MYHEKAQTTLFILLSLLLLIGFGFIFYVNTESRIKEGQLEQIENLPLQFQSLNIFVNSCIESTAKEAIIFISQHGGYFNLTELYHEHVFLNVPYYFYIDMNVMPSKNKFEQELSRYIDKNLFACINSFSEFKNQGYEIEYLNINTKTTIRPDNVLFQVNFPIKIKKGRSETILSTFSNSVNNIRLNEIYEISKKITGQHASNPDFVPLSFISNLTKMLNISIFLDQVNNDTLLFNVIDNKSLINDEPLVFRFANKYRRYSCSYLPSGDDEFSKWFILNCLDKKIKEVGYYLYIEEIPDFIIPINTTLFYAVKTSGKDIYFYDYTELFDINQSTGIINFTPTIEDVGDYLITIEVKDKTNDSKLSFFRLNISEE